MTDRQSTYRVKIKRSGTPPNESYGVGNFQELGCLTRPAIQGTFVSRAKGLADANQSRLRLVEAARRP